jgi:hypothetical protein
MPLYSVTLYRKVIREQFASTKIEANSEAEAKLIAVEHSEARSLTWSDHNPEPAVLLYHVEIDGPVGDAAPQFEVYPGFSLPKVKPRRKR